MTDPIRFWHRGSVTELREVPATTTVLAWLRTTRLSLGTREGCNEGDCGACAVVIARPDEVDGLELSVRHACTMLVPMLHGAALVTVEDLAGDELHPMQQALVDGRGSQCGFCTPGIAVSLWRLHHDAIDRGERLTADDVRVGLAGHICRCTGYRSIVEAAVDASDAVAPGLDAEGIRLALASIPDDEPLDYSAADTTYVAPTDLASLARVRAERPGARLIAGGTDLLPDVPGRGELPTDWIGTGRVSGFDAVEVGVELLSIGGGASIEAAWRALAGLWPALDRGWRRFASPPIREAGTVAGNLVTGSPVGDSPPLLLALDARVVLASASSERSVPLSDFYAGYRTTVLRADEVVARIEVPLARPLPDVRMYKVARRFDNDIAAVSAALALVVESGVISGVRVAFGGLSATPRRATAIESALLGQAWDEQALDRAMQAVDEDYTPMSDARGSAPYRSEAARGLLRRWWLQTRPVDPLSDELTEVWGAP
jgi:xanthine dehydrogenase small subunit